MLVEKFEMGIFNLSFDFRRRFSEAVISAFDGHQTGFDVRRGQAIDEPDSLFMGDIFVICAVDTQRRSGFGRHPVQRTGLDVAVPLLLQISPQKQWQYFSGINAGVVRPGEVARAVEINDALDVAGKPGIATVAFKSFHTAGDSQKLRQVTASRSACLVPIRSGSI